MNRIRLSTTVDAALLTSARGVRHGLNDAALIEPARRAAFAAVATDKERASDPIRRRLWAEWSRRYKQKDDNLKAG